MERVYTIREIVDAVTAAFPDGCEHAQSDQLEKVMRRFLPITTELRDALRQLLYVQCGTRRAHDVDAWIASHAA